MRTDSQTDITKVILYLKIFRTRLDCIRKLLPRSLYGTVTITTKATEYGLLYRDAASEQPNRQAWRVLLRVLFDDAVSCRDYINIGDRRTRMELGWNDFDWEKPQHSVQNLFQCSLSTTHYTWSLSKLKAYRKT